MTQSGICFTMAVVGYGSDALSFVVAPEDKNEAGLLSPHGEYRKERALLCYLIAAMIDEGDIP
jgi:hypothetical protein